MVAIDRCVLPDGPIGSEPIDLSGTRPEAEVHSVGRHPG